MENPNGSIGTVLPYEVVRAVVEKAHRCNAIAFLDEAYYLFYGQNVLPLYLEFDNVIITRTFSKDLGIAGLRCGYLLSQKENIQSFRRVKPMYEVSNAAVAFAIASLEYPDHIQKFVKDVKAGLQYLQASLQAMGLVVAGGCSNFLVVYVGEDIDISAIIRHLKTRGILVRRPFQMEALRGWLRISGGNVTQMQQFVTAFTEALESAGWCRENYIRPEGM